MSPTPILSLTGIGYAYAPDRPPALHGVSLDIAAGSLVAILGPNGGGKTTLLLVLLGLLPPREGQLTIAGQPHAAYSRRALSRLIGLVPQHEHIPFDFALLDYVLLGRAPYLGPLEMPGKDDRAVARRALDTVGLAGLQDRAVTALSGGERQLAMIARALAQAPRILLLDEPTSHLDLANRQAVQNVLRKLADQGVTIIFTTHDPHLAAAMADHAVLIRGGSLLAAGPLETVFTAERLSATYGIALRVVACSSQRVVLA